MQEVLHAHALRHLHPQPVPADVEADARHRCVDLRLRIGGELIQSRQAKGSEQGPQYHLNTLRHSIHVFPPARFPTLIMQPCVSVSPRSIPFPALGGLSSTMQSTLPSHPLSALTLSTHVFGTMSSNPHSSTTFSIASSSRMFFRIASGAQVGTLAPGRLGSGMQYTLTTALDVAVRFVVALNSQPDVAPCKVR